MGCRPDYLLYPEKNTREERAIRMRFFDNAAQLLPIKQDENNSFIAGNDYPSIDHIIPISKGGQHTWDNVQLAHMICNSIKNNKM